MKKIHFIGIVALSTLLACGNTENKQTETTTNTAPQALAGQETATQETPQEEEAVPGKPISYYVPNGWKILNQTKGNLNLDAYDDVVLILENKDESSKENFRPTLLLMGDASGNYSLARENNYTVHSANDGGQMGDPFTGVTIKNGYFSIEHMGGGGAERWVQIITYKYSKEESEWYLHKDGTEFFSADEPNKVTSSTIKTTKDFGKVPFGNYRLE